MCCGRSRVCAAHFASNIINSPNLCGSAAQLRCYVRLEISTQTQLRRQGLPSFCYLCGRELEGADAIDRDHCPPKGFFAPNDRANFPVILPTHRACNNAWHGADDLAGILTDALHSRQKSQDERFTKRLEAYSLPFNGQEAAALRNVPLAAIALRVVRGMHALFYKSYLPLQTRNSIHIPLPAANLDTGEVEQPLDQAFVFSGAVRRARLTNSADQITAYNGNFRYACVWDHTDGGTPLCIFAFDIYGFHYLGPSVTNFPRCFVGMYVPALVPADASWASKVHFSVSRSELLDPWQRT
jgi:hypothetical protein